MAYGPGKKDHDRHIDMIGFAPDLDVDIPGNCAVMTNATPSAKGWMAARTLDRSSHRFQTTGWANTIQTASWLDGARSLWVATRTKMYLHSSTAVIDATGVIAFNSTAQPPSVAVLGGVTVAALPGVTIAQSNGLAAATGTFTSIVSAPVARHVVTASRFVMAFNLGTASLSDNGWRCCARDNASSWTLSPASLATQGILADACDGIKTACAFGDDIIAFKSDRAYRGRFVAGDAEVWKWELLPFAKGALWGRTAIAYRQGIIFLSFDGLYYYDGATFTNLMEERMAEWWSKRCVDQYLASIAVDEIRDLIYVNALVFSSDTSLTYNFATFTCSPAGGSLKKPRWSLWNNESLLFLFPGPATYPGPWSGGGIIPRHKLLTAWAGPRYSGSVATGEPREVAAPATANSVASITTNDFGDAFIDSELTRASIKFTTAPTGTTPLIFAENRNTLDAAPETGPNSSRAADGLFNIRQNARWHRLSFSIYGDWEASGWAVETTPVGLR